MAIKAPPEPGKYKNNRGSFRLIRAEEAAKWRRTKCNRVSIVTPKAVPQFDTQFDNARGSCGRRAEAESQVLRCSGL